MGINLFYVKLREMKKRCYIKHSRGLLGDKMSVSSPPPADPDGTHQWQAQVQGRAGQLEQLSRHRPASPLRKSRNSDNRPLWSWVAVTAPAFHMQKLRPWRLSTTLPRSWLSCGRAWARTLGPPSLRVERFPPHSTKPLLRPQTNSSEVVT